MTRLIPISFVLFAGISAAYGSTTAPVGAAASVQPTHIGSAAATTSEADTRAGYYECTDHGGARYRMRQRLSDKYHAFFQACAPLPDPLQSEGQRGSELAVISRTRVAPLAFPRSATRERPAPRTPLRSKPSRELERLFRKVADKYRIDVHLLAAIAHVESRFDVRAISPKGALGLMQVMPATGQRYGVSDPQTLTNAATNLRVSAEYLRDLAELFDARLDLVLAAYNAGEGAVRRYGDRVPPFAETKSYVAAVMSTYDDLKAAATLSATQE